MLIVFAALYIGAIIFLCRQQLSVASYMLVLCCSFLASLLGFIWSGPLYQNTLSWDSQNLTLCLYQTVLLLSRCCPFRAFAVVQTLIFGAYMIENYFFWAEGKVTLLNYAMNSVVELVYTVFLALIALSREIAVRGNYNYMRIVQVEIERTQEHLHRLVPCHVLTGVKNDQRVFDTLANVTVMHITVGGLEFTGHARASKALGELHKIYCKFDSLCDTIGV